MLVILHVNFRKFWTFQKLELIQENSRILACFQLRSLGKYVRSAYVAHLIDIDINLIDIFLWNLTL